jgi:serine-type D-Ala-D-Ala carboxypeptidase/endopeptidase
MRETGAALQALAAATGVSIGGHAALHQVADTFASTTAGTVATTGVGLLAGVATYRAGRVEAGGLRAVVDRLGPAGLVVAVADGPVAEVRAFGSLQEGARVEAGSVTKLFTARLLEELAREGVVDLDEPAVECLGLQWRLSPRVTLRALAEHRAGLPRLPRRAWSTMRRHPDDPYRGLTEEALRASLPPLIPRPRWSRYSNLGYALLGHALAARAGSSWSELVRARITDPLGLTDTAPDGPVAQPHRSNGSPTPPWTLDAVAPAGALRSTAADLMRFLAAPSDRLGWAQDDDQRWHNGSTGGSCAFAGISPASGRRVVLLANIALPDDVTAAGLHLLRHGWPSADELPEAVTAGEPLTAAPR